MLEVGDTFTAGAMAGHLQRLRISGTIDVDEIVPAASTVLVRCGSSDALATVVRRATEFDPVTASADMGAIVEIPVRYVGPDLDDVAAATGLTTNEVVRRHSATVYTAAFSGFAPGFTYLVGLHPSLHLPRRSTPRSRVLAGSVAIGAEFAGVYPTASPGGWHLLGSTDAVLWDLGRRVPALVPPGCRVRFVDRTRQ